MSAANATPEQTSHDRLLLESLLTLSIAMLRLQTDLAEIRAMLDRQPMATPTATATPARSMGSTASTWLQYLSLARQVWAMLVWASGTKLGQAVIGFLMPLIMSEAKWGWLTALVKRLLGWG